MERRLLLDRRTRPRLKEPRTKMPGGKEPRTEEPRTKEDPNYKFQKLPEFRGAFGILLFVFFIWFLVFFCIPSLVLVILVLGSLYLTYSFLTTIFCCCSLITSLKNLVAS